MKLDKELVAASSAPLVLSVLGEGDSYGYAIIQRVRAFSSKVVPSRTRPNINDVVREVVAIAAHEIEQEQVALRTDLAEDLPTIIADRVEMHGTLHVTPG